MRTKVAAQAQPWTAGWDKLVANRHSSLDWKPRPDELIYRGKNPDHAQNYPNLYNDIAAAYACALRWRVSGDAAYADKAVEIMNAWSSTIKAPLRQRRPLPGGRHLRIPVCQRGRDHAGLSRMEKGDFAQFQKMMLDIFYR